MKIESINNIDFDSIIKELRSFRLEKTRTNAVRVLFPPKAKQEVRDKLTKEALAQLMEWAALSTYLHGTTIGESIEYVRDNDTLRSQSFAAKVDLDVVPMEVKQLCTIFVDIANQALGKYKDLKDEYEEIKRKYDNTTEAKLEALRENFVEKNAE